MSRNWVVLVAVHCIVGLALSESASALTYPFTYSGSTYTVVEPDPFLSGGTAGNTVRISNPGQFWATTTGNLDGLYNWRNFGNSGVNLWLNQPAGAAELDRDLFEISGQDVMPPDLRTTITGLPDNSYDVFLMMLVEANNPSNPIQPATLGADLDVGQSVPTTLRGGRNQPGVIKTGIIITPDNPGYEVALTPLGTVTGTEIKVLVGPMWAGDLNHDGINNQDDLNIVLSHFGQFVTPGDRSMGDTNGDGFISQPDYLAVYYEAWGEKGYPPGRRGDYIGIAYKPSGSAPNLGGDVPEPSVFALAAIALTIFYALARGHTRKRALPAVVALITLISTSAAYSAINGSFVQMTTEGGTSPPAGRVSQDLVVNASTDWLASQLRIVITSGTNPIYQDFNGGVPDPTYSPPNPSLFSSFPTLRWDTYLSGSGGTSEPAPKSAGAAIDIGGAGAFPNGGQFNNTGINLQWFTTLTSDVGTFTLGRFTLGNTAQGTWQLRLDCVDQTAPFLLSGNVQNGLLVSSVPGDYNGNGKYEVADYVTWRKNPTGFGGDPTGYNNWRANFGTAGSGSGLEGSSSVPEPRGAILLAAGIAAIIGNRRLLLSKRNAD